MGPGSIRNRFNFRYAQDSQVGLPLMEAKQWIVVGAQILRKTRASNRLLEHLTERQAIDDSPLNSEADDSARVLVHHDQHPIRLQPDRLAPKQIEAPQSCPSYDR